MGAGLGRDGGTAVGQMQRVARDGITAVCQMHRVARDGSTAVCQMQRVACIAGKPAPTGATQALLWGKWLSRAQLQVVSRGR